MAEIESPDVVELVDAGVPADQGLSALGLLMQLAGHVLGAIGCLGFAVLVLRLGVHGSVGMWLFAIFASSCLRSMFQLAAGKQLVHGDGADPARRFRGVRLYTAFAIAQSLGVAAILAFALGAGWLAITAGAGLLVWPIALRVIIALPRFARFDRGLPVSEDKGFEGASILMTLFGLTAALSTGLAAWLLAHAGDELRHGMTVILLAALMLFARTLLHAHAGISGLRTTSLDATVAAANRYASFGVVSAFCAGGALLFAIVAEGAAVHGLVFVCAATWLLLAWPTIVRRFFGDRQFTDLLAGGDAPIHRRAPDAGLTWLGWLLFALAAWNLSFDAPALFASADVDRTTRTLMALAGTTAGHSVWWSVGVTVLEGWAGFELVRMSPQSKAIATVYGLVAAALAVYFAWPALAMMRHVSLAVASTPDFVFFLGTLALSLIVPVGTIALVHRNLAPAARARYRRPT